MKTASAVNFELRFYNIVLLYITVITHSVHMLSYSLYFQTLPEHFDLQPYLKRRGVAIRAGVAKLNNSLCKSYTDNTANILKRYCLYTWTFVCLSAIYIAAKCMSS